MKKIRNIALLILVLLTIVSCTMATTVTPEKNNPNYDDNSINVGKKGEYLVTVSRLRGIRNSSEAKGFDEDGEWEEGADIVGVLLSFHNGKSNQRDENGYLKNDPYAFYIEELDYIGYNGDNMAYNYILYIPSVIQDVYKEAGGINPYSGNPFWWYMKTYLNMSLPEIVDDYEDVIDYLLRNGKRLPYPKVEDVTGHWSSSYSRLNIRYVFHESNYPVEANMSKIGFWMDEKTNTLWMPSSVSGEYTAGGGSANGRDALDWYISTYMKEETKDFANPSEFIKSDVFKATMEALDFSSKEKTPSGRDLDVEFTEQMDDEFDDDVELASLNQCSFYYDGMIRDEEGEPIRDNQIHFVSYGEWTRGTEGIGVYFPEYLKDEYEQDNGKYKYNGSLFWWFIQKYHGVSDNTLSQYISNHCSMPIEKMKKYVTIPTEPSKQEDLPEKPEGIEEIHSYPDNSKNTVSPDKITVISDIRNVTTIDGKVYINNSLPWILLEFGAPEGKPDGAFYLPVPDGSSLKHGRYHFYVPTAIQKAYMEGEGVNPDSGNPLWWYLKTYYNVSLRDVKNNILVLFDTLLNNADNLIMPDSKDVKGTWIANSSNIRYRTTYAVSNYPAGTMSEMGLYLDKNSNTLYIPSAIWGEYKAAGMEGWIREALDWYLKQYHGYETSEDVTRLLEGTNVNEALLALDYPNNLPKGSDITEPPRAKANNIYAGNLDNYQLYHAFFYYPGRLLDSNGNPVEDGKIYIDTNSKGHMTVWMPESIKQEQLHDRGRFLYNGDLFWDFIKKHHGVTDSEVRAIFDNDFKIPRVKLDEWLKMPR